jgi:signal transduction histidine kinase
MNHINIISRNTNRLKKLADDLSDTTRIESNNLISNKEKTDIKEAASTIIKDVKIGLDVKLNKEK